MSHEKESTIQSQPRVYATTDGVILDGTLRSVFPELETEGSVFLKRVFESKTALGEALRRSQGKIDQGFFGLEATIPVAGTVVAATELPTRH